MILVADRNHGAQKLLADIAATGAEVLVRLKNGRRMPVLARYRDGSYLSGGHGQRDVTQPQDPGRVAPTG